MKKIHLWLLASMVTGAANAALAPSESAQSSGYKGDRVARLERMLKAKTQAQMDMQRRIDELQQEVSSLRGVTEEQNHQLTQILNRQRKLYNRISKISDKKQVQTSTPKSNDDVSSTLSETEQYQQAVNLVLNERKYNEAIPAFEVFLKKYPQSSYTSNAYYWLGQLQFSKNQYKRAKSSFEAVVNKYPKSTKRSDCLFKLALIAQKEGQAKKAKSLYQKVVDEYPESSVSKLANSKLKQVH